MEDKAVGTTCDNFLTPVNFNCESNTSDRSAEMAQWDIQSVDQLLRLLIENKITAIKISSDSCENNRTGISSDRRKRYGDQDATHAHAHKSHHRHQHRHHHHHHHHHHNHCNCEGHRHYHRHGTHHEHSDNENLYERCSSISKVQRWSEDLDMEGTFVDPPPFDDWDGTPTSPNEFPVGVKRSIIHHKDGYTVVSVDNNGCVGNVDRPMAKRKKKKKKKRRRRMERQISKGSRSLDPEDLPKRARWTIIITSGLLILACMFLVGITLRMAPIIDQMVRSQNEELMISLNRNINQTGNGKYTTENQFSFLV